MNTHRQVSTASPAQLSYLKALASQTGTTFTYPRNGHDASREIRRLKELKTRHGCYLEEPRRESDHTELPYATEQKPGETLGYGASARRTDPPPPRCPTPAVRRRRPADGEPLELGHYETKTGEKRALFGIRVQGKPRIIDAAVAERSGRIYTVEKDLHEHGGYGEVIAIVNDYIAQAERLGQIPMAKTPHKG